MPLKSGTPNIAVSRQGVNCYAESLSGRVAIQHLLPMGYREIRECPDQDSFLRAWLFHDDLELAAWQITTPSPLYERIWHGGFPKILQLPDHLIPNYWESYLQTYIERDVRMVANIGSLQTFGRFFALLAAYTAQEINPAHIGRELGIDRKTAVHWTEIAEATYQWKSIPPYSRNPVKRVAAKQKGYFTDTGFACHLQRIGTPDAIPSHPLAGRLVESYVVLEILKSFQNWPIAPNLYHYRTHGGAELDLILEINGRLYPIEIKSKSQPDRRDTVGFQSFRDCFPHENIASGLIVCGIESPAWITENVLAVPWWLL